MDVVVRVVRLLLPTIMLPKDLAAAMSLLL
jgi:hypothetical protein